MTTETTETTKTPQTAETPQASGPPEIVCTSCGTRVDPSDAWTMQAPHIDGDVVTCAACAGDR